MTDSARGSSDSGGPEYHLWGMLIAFAVSLLIIAKLTETIVGLAGVGTWDQAYLLTAATFLIVCVFALCFAAWHSALRRELRRRRQAEKQFRNLFECAPDATIVTDASGVIRLANEQTSGTFGYLPEELVGKKIEILVPERFHERHEGERARYAKTPGRRPMGQGRELLARRKDGSEFFCEISLSPAWIDGVPSVLSSIRDVSRQKANDSKLKEKSLELARSNAELERFAYVASHDLEEPLRTIHSYLGLIERKLGKADEDVREFIAFAQDAAKRQREMISGLLAYSRVMSNPPPPRPVDLNRSVDNVLASLKVAIAEIGAEVVVDDLPTVPADPYLIEILFQNLIGNALKYRNGTTAKIRVTAERAGPEWTISIKDNGVGIPAEARERIFELFTRLHGREMSGTGIGLATCKKIVERWGGRIWVESSPGEGSDFRFTLPVGSCAKTVASHDEPSCPTLNQRRRSDVPAETDRLLH